jgi:hypothetical protein
MPSYSVTGRSARTPWADEEERGRFEKMLSQHGDVRFLGVEHGRAACKLIIEAESKDDAVRRRDDALRALFGNNYGFGGPDRLVGPGDPFPDHPPAPMCAAVAFVDRREAGCTKAVTRRL